MSSVPPKLGILGRSSFSDGAEEMVQGPQDRIDWEKSRVKGWNIQLLWPSKQESAMFPQRKPAWNVNGFQGLGMFFILELDLF